MIHSECNPASRGTLSFEQIVEEVAHDVRNPLMIIGLSVQQLLGSTNDETSRARLRSIAAEVERIDTRLTRLSELRRALRPKRRVFDAGTLLKEVASLVSADCPSRGIQMECRTDDTPAWVEGDPESLKNALLDLVRNAIGAANKGGRLTLRALSGDPVILTISDDGPDMLPNLRAKIFSAFFTGPGHSPRHGLAEVKRIIDAQPGSSIEIECADEGGAVIKITLPRAGAKAAFA